MSIKPIDFQVMLPKTSEISKMHNDDQHKNLAQQQQQMAVLQQKAEHAIRQVHAQGEVPQAKIKEKQDKSKDNQQDKKKKETSPKGSSTYHQPGKASEEQTNSVIDIKI